MTTHQLHDALSHLPEDLIAEADARRSAPPRVIPFRRYAAMAACFVLVLASSLFALNFLPRGGAMKEAAAEVQMAGEVMENAAAPILEDTASDVLSQALPDATLRAESTVEEVPAEEHADPAAGAADNALYTLTHLSDGEVRILPQNNAAVLELFLARLQFDPMLVCNCLAEYRLETGGEAVYEISFTEGFIRDARGQCLLSQIQLEELQAILEVTP